MPISNPYANQTHKNKNTTTGNVIVNPYLKKTTKGGTFPPASSWGTPQAKKQPPPPPPSSSSVRAVIVTPKSAGKLSKSLGTMSAVPNNINNSNSNSDQTTSAPNSSTSTTTPNHPQKPPLTLKQKLKLEIASLKKQRQLLQWQKEAKARAKVVADEQAKRNQARQALMEQQEAAKQARLVAKQQKLQEQEQRRQAKKLEKLQEQQRKQQLEQEKIQLAQQSYQMALLQYQQEAASYPFRYAQWVEQRQQYMAWWTMQQMASSTISAPGTGGALLSAAHHPILPTPNQHLPHQYAPPPPPQMDVFRCMPMHLLFPPLPPLVPQPPRMLLAKSSTTSASATAKNNKTIMRLSKGLLEGPSPFATTHELLLLQQPQQTTPRVVILIRSPHLDQVSFGVNLKAETRSRLVEPPPITSSTTNATNTLMSKEMVTVPSSVITTPTKSSFNDDPMMAAHTIVEANDATPTTPIATAVGGAVPPSHEKIVIPEPAETLSMQNNHADTTSIPSSVSKSHPERNHDHGGALVLAVARSRVLPANHNDTKDTYTAGSSTTGSTTAFSQDHLHTTTSPTPTNQEENTPLLALSMQSNQPVPPLDPAINHPAADAAVVSVAAPPLATIPVGVTSTMSTTTTTMMIEQPAQAPTRMNPTPLQQAQEQQKQLRRPRRRRVHFTAMVVCDAVKQNQRWKDRTVAIVVSPTTTKAEEKIVVETIVKQEPTIKATSSDATETINVERACITNDALTEIKKEVLYDGRSSTPLTYAPESKAESNTIEVGDMEDCTQKGTATEIKDDVLADCAHSPERKSEYSITESSAVEVAETTDAVMDVKNEDEDAATPLSTEIRAGILSTEAGNVMEVCKSEQDPVMEVQQDVADIFATQTSLSIVQQPEEQPTLLQPGDIILKIGGVDVAGMTFAEACKVFHQKSVQVKVVNTVNGEVTTEIQVELVVARAKKIVAKPAVLKEVPVKCEPKTASPVSLASRPLLQPGGMMAMTKHSPANFSFVELAVLADCVIQAIHDQPGNRLLGQGLSRSLLEKNTTIFRKVDGIKECVLNPRSPEMIVDQWNQVCLGIQANLSDRARENWTQQAFLEDQLGKEDTSDAATTNPTSPLFSSDAERTALRQLPRPAKGCRCQRRDHEYLHDVRCTLYRDICRLVPSEELKELQYDPDDKNSNAKSRSSADKELKTVEAAYKDRMFKIMNVVEMEKAEARFVAKMEEVQVQQLHKAIFAPNLATMVLSTIVELQKEFPSNTARWTISDDLFEEDVDDEALTLAGKRKQGGSVSSSSSSLVSPKKKKAKLVGVEHLSFKYLIRIAQLIGNTWGHVYREPAHDDYAWRWELYHGHNSDGAQWEATSKNPRSPNTLSFDAIRHVMDAVGTTMNISKLSTVSQAIADLEDRIQSELMKANVIRVEDKPVVSPMPKAERFGDIQPMEIDSQTTPDVVASTASSPKVQKLDIPNETVEQMCLAAYLLSPASTGLYDELLALVKTGVLEISASGIPILAEDWAAKVDYVVLQDMEDHWKNDTMNRYCLCPTMKEMLQGEWIFEDDSWALSSDPEDVIYHVSELEEWRHFFRGQLEAQTNLSEGIGRFGL